MRHLPSLPIAALLALSGPAAHAQTVPATAAQPLVVGEAFTVDSRALHETRRINVFVPAVAADSPTVRLPVLYMPDGGIGEDFLHIAGLVQILTMNGSMRPFILVGIENTERRRDLTGPTSVASDSTIARHVGGSADFRRFLGAELVPLIDARYRTTGERAIVGESLAGLFVVECFLLEPGLFDTYIAVDPSLWWNGGELVRDAIALTEARPHEGTTLYLAWSSEPDLARLTKQLAGALRAAAVPGLTLVERAMPAESHGTIYHPAALEAFRRILGPRR